MSVTYDAFGCALWPHVDREGYGRRGRKLAHRAAWEDVHGPIADGMELDHLCRRRNCIALHHLELVTRSVNESRKTWRNRAKRTTCPRGHSMSNNAIVLETGGRVCRTCNLEAKESR